MTADKPISEVPGLRFPEFRSTGDWHSKPLREIAERIQKLTGKPAVLEATGETFEAVRAARRPS